MCYRWRPWYDSKYRWKYLRFIFTFFVNTQGKRSNPWQLYSRKRLDRSLRVIFPFFGQLWSLFRNPAIDVLFYIHQKSRFCLVSRVGGEDLDTRCITSSSELRHQHLLCRLPACLKQPLIPEQKKKGENVVSSSYNLVPEALFCVYDCSRYEIAFAEGTEHWSFSTSVFVINSRTNKT